MGLEARTNGLSYYEINHPEISRIRVFPTPEEAARAAAEKIIGLVRVNPQAAITYATGDTMIPLYKTLAQAASERRIDFTKTKGFHLDEYHPCAPDEEHSFVKYLREKVWGPLGIRDFHEINGLTRDPEAEANRYNELLLSRQPIDLVILGIGPGSSETNSGGHIGFNESGTPFSAETHLAKLDITTVKRDRDERGQNTSDKAITVGIANILSAKRIFLVAYGQNKGKALRESLWGDIGPQSPASALRLEGHKVTLFIDEAAASQFGKL